MEERRKYKRLINVGGTRTGKQKRFALLFQITYKDLCFALEGFNIVTFAAPCSKWAIGKSLDSVLKYWKKRGAKIIQV